MSPHNDIYSTGNPTQFGILGYYDLLNWWETEFTTDQKLYITKKYTAEKLTTGQILGSSASSINFLIGMQSWFNTLPEDAISEKILKKAESLISANIPVLDIHFLYGAFIQHYYKKRLHNSVFYDLSKYYCRKQIELSSTSMQYFLKEFGFLPRHKGFEQLAIILEKENNLREALELCLKAQNEGWKSDWNKRISNLQKKLDPK